MRRGSNKNGLWDKDGTGRHFMDGSGERGRLVPRPFESSRGSQRNTEPTHASQMVVFSKPRINNGEPEPLKLSKLKLEQRQVELAMNDNDLQLIHSLLMNIDFLTGCYLVPSVKTYIPQAMCNAKKLEVKFENVLALTVRSYYFCRSRLLTWLQKNRRAFF